MLLNSRFILFLSFLSLSISFVAAYLDGNFHLFHNDTFIDICMLAQFSFHIILALTYFVLRRLKKIQSHDFLKAWLIIVLAWTGFLFAWVR